MVIYNKHFSRNYINLEEFEAGIVLTGAEVKSIRAGGVRLEKAYAKPVGTHLMLLQAEILPYKFASNPSYDPVRPRILLLTKKELLKLKQKLQTEKRTTLVPVKVYIKHNLVKVTLAIARGKVALEQRKEEKKKTLEKLARKEAALYE